METTKPRVLRVGNATQSPILGGAPIGRGFLTAGTRHAGGCRSSEKKSDRSLAVQHRRLDCACVSVALAADPAGSSFLGRRDSSAMESYDVIANQPVVIDNVSCIFPISKGTYVLLPKGIASQVSVWASGSLSLVWPVRRVQPPLPPSFPLPVVRRQGNRPATMGWRTWDR